MKEVEFGWWGGVVVCNVIFMSNPTQLSLVEVVLRLSFGCDNKSDLTMERKNDATYCVQCTATASILCT